MREPFWSWKHFFSYSLTSVAFFLALSLVFSWLAEHVSDVFGHEANRVWSSVLFHIGVLAFLAVIWIISRLWKRRR
jgi:membrane protein DedA with SNARE-associated domain